MGRDLVELLPVDDAQSFQIPEGRSEHGVGNPGHRLFLLPEPAG